MIDVIRESLGNVDASAILVFPPLDVVILAVLSWPPVPLGCCTSLGLAASLVLLAALVVEAANPEACEPLDGGVMVGIVKDWGLVNQSRRKTRSL